MVHRISKEEAAYKLCKVRRLETGKGGIPYVATHDGRTIRYPDPEIKVRVQGWGRDEREHRSRYRKAQKGRKATQWHGVLRATRTGMGRRVLSCHVPPWLKGSWQAQVP